jgi:hypothetical protein
MIFNKDIHSFQNNAFDIIIYLTWILYISIVLGLSANAPEYLDTLQSCVKLYVSLFLIIRFNPFRRVKFTNLDAKIAFSAGIFLLGTTAIDSILNNYLSNIKQYLNILQFN